MKLEKFSFGLGDRFGMEGSAQLKAVIKAQEMGIHFTPVWNKSNREHKLIHTTPADQRNSADAAVKKMNWEKPYFVDADHINSSSVSEFIESCDFFTIDTADLLAKVPEKAILEQYLSSIQLPFEQTEFGEYSFHFDRDFLTKFLNKYALAIDEVQNVYQTIKNSKNSIDFITEVSMDEVDIPQNPAELFLILFILFEKGIPVNTIAPRFSGRFNKGVDYVGDTKLFEKEFEADVLACKRINEIFKTGQDVKLSIHSGSDKFAIYDAISSIATKYNAGFHIKTAGTSWIEEVIGLALCGGEALKVVKTIYSIALQRFDELAKPYEFVLDIRKEKLPTISEIGSWDADHFARSLRHDQSDLLYNPDLRQLIHVAYKVAVEMGQDFYSLLGKHRDVIEEQVYTNIYNRHILKLFQK